MEPYTGERCGDLRRLDLQRIRERVQEILIGFPEVAGAYLFGSALDFVRSDSDIDLGLITRDGLNLEAEERLAGRVEARLGWHGPHLFQISLIRPCGNTFAFRVLRDGELIYVADEERLTNVIEMIGRRHEDLEPFRKTFWAALGMGI